MQKGHRQSAAPILLLTLVAILALSLIGTAASAGRSDVGPLLRMKSLDGLPQLSGKRPFIGRTLPLTQLLTFSKQASGPDADYDLTPTASATEELMPNASPGVTQNRVVFVSNGADANGDGQIDATAPANPHYNLWIMRSDGSEQYKLADLTGDQVDPAYDPSGGLVAFSQQVNGVWQIFTIEVRDPTVIKQITTGAGNKRHATWSGDSNWIAFQADVNGNWDIYKIAATGIGSIVPVTSGADNDTDPAWAWHGNVIAFTRDNGTVKRIYATDPTGANTAQLSNGGGTATVNDQQPSWRQDATNSELAFASDRLTEAGDSTANYNIWRMAALGEANGASATLVSDKNAADTTSNLNPTWSVEIARTPTRVFFESFRANGQADIWGMQLRDWIPPILRSVPTVTPRQATPGSDVTISVPVYDQDSGVASVFAIVKDPDQKTFQAGTYLFNTSFTGVRQLERDCQEVSAAIPLTDDQGTGVFSGTWSTPTGTGHDYIVDILVTDVAGNSLRYDDVYGFSTRTFAPQSRILFVDDYCEGQAFLGQLGVNNHDPAGFPVESYYLSNPGGVPGFNGNSIYDIDYDSVAGPYRETYDVWRVICRGQVPQSVYQYYLPTIEYQIDPKDAANPTGIEVPATRKVPVAERAIIWASPHTGDVWTAGGSLIDASVQSDIASYVQRGGRILIAGEDIAWALSLAGTTSNSFMTNTLHASYISDISATNFGIGGLAADPVAFDPWGGGHYVESTDTPLAMQSSLSFAAAGSPWYNDAAEYSRRPDSINVLSPAIKIFGINSAENTAFTGAACGLRWEDTAGNDGKVVFLSFGFEQINREYHTGTSTIPAHCANKRSHLLHNAMCWERTGGFQGRVISISDGGQAVNDPAPIVSAVQGGTVRYAVQCQKDGTFVMQGLPPGGYTLQCTRPGYDVQHTDTTYYTHGGLLAPVADFVIHRAQPGAVSGKVVSATDSKPLANVTVSVAPDPNAVPVPSATGLPDPVLTAADGSYTLPSIPAGGYIITANGSSILYNSVSTSATVAVGDTITVNFALRASDGTLKVSVTDVDTNTAISGAAVTATDSLGARTVVYTDDAGQVSADFAPGTYSVVVTAAGYAASAAQSVTIEPQATTSINVALQHQPGGAIVGRVVGAGSGSFLSGVTIHVYFGDQEIATGETSASTVTTIGGVAYNYSIPSVDTGTVTVTAERSGFTAVPTSRNATITSGQTTTDVNFQMQALYTFPKGLQLVSFPADYSAIDPAVLLGISDASTLKMATWESVRQLYRLYPDAPADHFRLGVGYWMNLTSPADLSEEGVPASNPVEIPLEAGWNLVGCPYNQRIDFYTVHVKDMNGVTYTLQQSLSQGIVASGLYAYALGGYQSVGVLSPYTGYWLKTTQPCSLIISSTTGALAAGETRVVTPKPENGWVLPLTTTCGGATDAATFIGAARAATAGCDFGTDQPKPPIPAMGSYVYTAIDNSSWTNYGGAYSTDVRASGVKSAWDLKVSTNLVGQKVRLAWGDMSSLPRDVRPMLVDLDNGQRTYMRTASAYVFTAKETPRRLQIIVDPSDASSLMISPLAAAPTGAGTAISYSLSQAASVEVTVSNIAGRLVRQLVGGQMQPAGANTVLWDGRDSGGVRVPYGRYLVTIAGKTDTGQQVRTIMPLQMVVR